MSSFLFFDMTHTQACTHAHNTNTNVNVNDTTDIKICLADVTQAEQMANILTTYTRGCRYMHFLDVLSN